MKEKASLTKRPPFCITKLMKTSGAYAAGSLGDIPRRQTGHFTRAQWGRHEHSWIPGLEIEVCTLCGKTRPKIVTP
jgi:hypothetical protein